MYTPNVKNQHAVPVAAAFYKAPRYSSAAISISHLPNFFEAISRRAGRRIKPMIQPGSRTGLGRGMLVVEP